MASAVIARNLSRAAAPCPCPAYPADLTAQNGAAVDHTYKITEIVGSSSTGIDDAVRSGIDRAGKTLRNLDWFEVTDIRGALGDGEVSWFQVTMKVGFRLDDGG
jgi:hypothetical protein